MHKKIYCHMCDHALFVLAEFILRFAWDNKIRNENLCNIHVRSRAAGLKKTYGVTCEVVEIQQPVPMLWS